MVKDDRVAFGAFCTWWGSIYEVARSSDTGTGIPTCPFCGGVLYEDPSLMEWKNRLANVPEDKFPDYAKVMNWQHDNRIPCSKSWSELRKKFDAASAGE